MDFYHHLHIYRPQRYRKFNLEQYAYGTNVL